MIYNQILKIYSFLRQKLNKSIVAKPSKSFCQQLYNDIQKYKNSQNGIYCGTYGEYILFKFNCNQQNQFRQIAKGTPWCVLGQVGDKFLYDKYLNSVDLNSDYLKVNPDKIVNSRLYKNNQNKITFLGNYYYVVKINDQLKTAQPYSLIVCGLKDKKSGEYHTKIRNIQNKIMNVLSPQMVQIEKYVYNNQKSMFDFNVLKDYALNTKSGIDSLKNINQHYSKDFQQNILQSDQFSEYYQSLKQIQNIGQYSEIKNIDNYIILKKQNNYIIKQNQNIKFIITKNKIFSYKSNMNIPSKIIDFIISNKCQLRDKNSVLFYALYCGMVQKNGAQNIIKLFIKNQQDYKITEILSRHILTRYNDKVDKQLIFQYLLSNLTTKFPFVVKCLQTYQFGQQFLKYIDNVINNFQNIKFSTKIVKNKIQGLKNKQQFSQCLNNLKLVYDSYKKIYVQHYGKTINQNNTDTISEFQQKILLVRQSLERVIENGSAEQIISLIKMYRNIKLLQQTQYNKNKNDMMQQTSIKDLSHLLGIIILQYINKTRGSDISRKNKIIKILEDDKTFNIIFDDLKGSKTYDQLSKIVSNKSLLNPQLNRKLFKKQNDIASDVVRTLQKNMNNTVYANTILQDTNTFINTVVKQKYKDVFKIYTEQKNNISLYKNINDYDYSQILINHGKTYQSNCKLNDNDIVIEKDEQKQAKINKDLDNLSKELENIFYKNFNQYNEIKDNDLYKKITQIYKDNKNIIDELKSQLDKYVFLGSKAKSNAIIYNLNDSTKDWIIRYNGIVGLPEYALIKYLSQDNKNITNIYDNVQKSQQNAFRNFVQHLEQLQTKKFNSKRSMVQCVDEIYKFYRGNKYISSYYNKQHKQCYSYIYNIFENIVNRLNIQYKNQEKNHKQLYEKILYYKEINKMLKNIRSILTTIPKNMITIDGTIYSNIKEIQDKLSNLKKSGQLKTIQQSYKQIQQIEQYIDKNLDKDKKLGNEILDNILFDITQNKNTIDLKFLYKSKDKFDDFYKVIIFAISYNLDIINYQDDKIFDLYHKLFNKTIVSISSIQSITDKDIKQWMFEQMKTIILSEIDQMTIKQVIAYTKSIQFNNQQIGKIINNLIGKSDSFESFKILMQNFPKYNELIINESWEKLGVQEDVSHLISNLNDNKITIENVKKQIDQFKKFFGNYFKQKLNIEYLLDQEKLNNYEHLKKVVFEYLKIWKNNNKDIEQCYNIFVKLYKGLKKLDDDKKIIDNLNSKSYKNDYYSFFEKIYNNFKQIQTQRYNIKKNKQIQLAPKNSLINSMNLLQNEIQNNKVCCKTLKNFIVNGLKFFHINAESFYTIQQLYKHLQTISTHQDLNLYQGFLSTMGDLVDFMNKDQIDKGMMNAFYWQDNLSNNLIKFIENMTYEQDDNKTLEQFNKLNKDQQQDLRFLTEQYNLPFQDLFDNQDGTIKISKRLMQICKLILCK